MIPVGMSSFISALEKDNSVDSLREVLELMANAIPLHATGRIVYTFNFELMNIREYYSIDVELKFYEETRNSRIIQTRKLTMDEYIHCHWTDDVELRENFLKMVKLIRK
jgi:hypothetical protein